MNRISTCFIAIVLVLISVLGVIANMCFRKEACVSDFNTGSQTHFAFTSFTEDSTIDQSIINASNEAVDHSDEDIALPIDRVITEYNTTSTTIKRSANIVDNLTTYVNTSVCSNTLPTTKHTTECFSEHKMTDLDYLAAVIYQEAGSNSIGDNTRRYVAEVVLNRVHHSSFPNTIYGVLTQRGQYGRYSKTGIHKLDMSLDGAARAYAIAEEVLRDGVTDMPKNVVFQAEFPQGSGVWKYVDGIYFCYE